MPPMIIIIMITKEKKKKKSSDNASKDLCKKGFLYISGGNVIWYRNCQVLKKIKRRATT